MTGTLVFLYPTFAWSGGTLVPRTSTKKYLFPTLPGLGLIFTGCPRRSVLSLLHSLSLLSERIKSDDPSVLSLFTQGPLSQHG